MSPADKAVSRSRRNIEIVEDDVPLFSCRRWCVALKKNVFHSSRGRERNIVGIVVVFDEFDGVDEEVETFSNFCLNY